MANASESKGNSGMSMMRLTKLYVGGAAVAMVLSGCAANRALTSPSGFVLGTNPNGETCTAAPNWTDPSFQGAAVKFSDSLSISCRGASAGALGRIRVFDDAAARSAYTAQSLNCPAGVPAVDVRFDGFDAATAKQCVDPALGFRTIVIDAQAGDQFLQVSSAVNSIGASFQAARVLAGLTTPDQSFALSNPFDPDLVPDLPSGFEQPTQRTASNEALSTILSRGTTLNFRGLHADASRFLRQALADLPADAPGNIRAALLLEAGLADSNLQFFATAQRNLNAAAEQIGKLSSADQRVLQPKLQIYAGLDALNQNEFTKALSILAPLADGSGSSSMNLSDPGTLVQLNSGLSGNSDTQNDVRSSIALPDEQALRDAFLRILGNWTRSVAELSQERSDPNAALSAIELAQADLNRLEEALDQGKIRRDGLLWLSARLLRQRGRVEASAGRYDRAVTLFDSAIRELKNGAIASFGTGREPAIAELQLERAAVVSRSNVSANAKRAAYETAVEALIESRDDSASFSTGLLQPYLDQLADEADNGSPDAVAKYFQALQVGGESGAARQLSALKEIVAQEAGVGAQLRELQNLARARSRNELDLAEADELGLSDSRKQELVAQQATLRDAYFELDQELQGVARLNQVSSAPASLEALQASLQPGEAYVRFAMMGDRVFGMLVEKDGAYAIRPRAIAEELLFFTDEVRKSIDTKEEYKVIESATLYRSLFEDVDAILRTKSGLVVDGGQVLAGLPASALISGEDAARKFIAQEDKLDYSELEFLANVLPTSVAMSPRSFINSRNLPGSNARRGLIGFASPQPVPSAPGAGQSVQIGNCFLTPAQVAELSRRFVPIADTEIKFAHEQLGLSGTPSVISGAAFSDQAVLNQGTEGGELSEYKVLHFATHGLTEGQFGCPESPAALLTSPVNGGGSDLLLDIEEIAQLRLDANLVVLSACQTASAIGERQARRNGDAQPGSTLEGMVRAFFAAEARAVLATYWETPNTGESAAFMREFYRAGKDQDIATALNVAQKQLIGEAASSHPYFWGSFFVVGDTDNKMLDSASIPQVAAR